MMIRHLRLLRSIQPNCCRSSTLAGSISCVSNPVYTSADPWSHSLEHIGTFYKVDPDMAKHVFSLKGLPRKFREKAEIFNEVSIMIRQPALEILHYLKQINPDAPAIRYILYGAHGSGKSISVAHVVHYAYQHEWLLVHVPWFADWINWPKEISPSSSHPGYFDTPVESAVWLQRFRIQNEGLLRKHNISTTQDYNWSKRETTSAGQPLTEVIDFGISRIKYANDAVGVVLEEVKKQTPDKKWKTLVAIDGVNSMFVPETHHRPCKGTTEQIPAFKFSLSRQFMELLKNDWNNAAIITTVDRMATHEDSKLDPSLNHQLRRPVSTSYLPRFLLRDMGFALLDPFVPIEVKNYTEAEFHSCLDYYSAMEWLQHPACNTLAGREELRFLTNCNPGDVLKYTDPL